MCNGPDGIGKVEAMLPHDACQPCVSMRPVRLLKGQTEQPCDLFPP